MIDARRRTAMHEAGHAVSSHLLGGWPATVSIGRERLHNGWDSLGHTATLDVEAWAIARSALFPRSEQDATIVRRELISFAGGPVAEAIAVLGHMPSGPVFGWSTWGGASDRERAGLLRAAAKRSGLLAAGLDEYVDSAAELLLDPGIWGAVRRVADEVLRFEEIDHALIVNAIAGW